MTEYADRKFKKTAAAATIAVVLGMAVFFIGRAVDARAQTVDKAPHPPAPEVHVATTPDTKKAEPKEETKATTKPDTKRGYDRTHPPPPQPQATPKGGPLPPGGINGSQCNVIIQTGGQGNIATGGNCAPVAQVHKEWVLRNEIHAGAEDEADTSYPRYEIIKLEDGRMAVRSWKKS